MFEYHIKSSIFHPGLLSADYERIFSRKFGLNQTRIDLANPVQSVIDINQWIHKNVQSETILDVVNESMLSENTILFISTIFFHTEWQDKFELEHTGRELFYDDKRETIHVEMMNHVSSYLMYIPPNNNWEILFKPFFESYEFAAIILPKSGSTVEEVLSDIEFEKMFRYLQKAEYKHVKLRLPKFKIQMWKDFVPVFKNLGITDIFDENHSYSGRMTNVPVAIGNIIQVINFSVDEHGQNISNTNDIQQESRDNFYEFCVNKPFIFVVYSHWKNLIYFSAVVNKPNAD
ncbi:Alpha-1-antiproteinase S [Thelohanellus kitauei]|uniref:Alpha-1-antiproteinase S n=1 Tax=Thelohanellus kitauei TaxID=669202 RepID=A0A0C2M8J8_THEKT|nr:Alpha-1-antiproteinase S [Thelohanellus kitauei]